MKVKLLSVAGLDEACRAVRLSFNSSSDENCVETSHDCDIYADDLALLKKLVLNGDSHAKVMRMVQVWLDIEAPRYWWAEMDTYKVGTTTMSESTMHTVTKRHLTENDFEMGFGGVLDYEWIQKLNDLIDNKDWYGVKSRLPESFLQRRIVNLNYQTLRHIYIDRKNHRLPQWKKFLAILNDLPFPELIRGGIIVENLG